MATPQPAPERENLAGLVERVTFHNEESGFSVLRVKARGHRDLITVIGHAATIGAGEFVQASGRWVNDRTHGVQFRADFLRSVPPTRNSASSPSEIDSTGCDRSASSRSWWRPIRAPSR